MRILFNIFRIWKFLKYFIKINGVNWIIQCAAFIENVPPKLQRWRYHHQAWLNECAIAVLHHACLGVLSELAAFRFTLFETSFRPKNKLKNKQTNKTGSLFHQKFAQRAQCADLNHFHCLMLAIFTQINFCTVFIRCEFDSHCIFEVLRILLF